MYLGYPTKKALCKAHGASYYKFIQKSKLYSIEDALKMAQIDESRIVISHDGVVGVEAIAAANGVTFNRLRYALYDKKLSIDDAIKHAKNIAIEPVKNNGIEMSPAMRMALGLK